MLVVVLGIAGAASAEESSSYGGVTPGSEGSDNLPPKVEEIPDGALMLTWPGFMMLEDGGSRFFVQTSKPVQTATKKGAGTFELVLRKTQVHLKNNFSILSLSYSSFMHTPIEKPKLSTP